MNRPKCPCVKSCPDRTSECHSKCARYSEYEAGMRKFYEHQMVMKFGFPSSETIEKAVKNLIKRPHKRCTYE